MHLVPKSVLFVPGNKPSMFEKAANAPAGAVIPDMEDAVPWGEKLAARRDIAANLDLLGGAGLPVIPRLNSLDTGLFDEDLEAVIGPRIIGVSVGKVRSAVAPCKSCEPVEQPTGMSAPTRRADTSLQRVVFSG